MEIADSARKHGISDEQMRQALVSAFREVTLGADRLLIIGADSTGRLLELVVLDPDDEPVAIHAMPLRRSSTSIFEVMTMRTKEELDRAAEETEKMLDELGPATTTADGIEDLRAVTAAASDVSAAEDALCAKVAAARDAGRSWARIGIALGISKQAAQQRFGQNVSV